MINLETLATEQQNSHSQHIDSVSTEDMLRIINEEDHKVADAVGAIIPAIAQAVDTIADKLRRGGRLFYMGSGTSGRLGILDAVECPPTYSTDPERIQGLIAGGYEAIFRAKEGAEDSPELGRQDLIDKNHQKAQTAKEKYDVLKQWQESSMAKAQKEAGKTYQRILNEYKAQKETMLELNKNLSRKEIAVAAAELDGQVVEAKYELKPEVKTLASIISSKILGYETKIS